MAARRAVQAKTLASNSNLSVSSAHNKSRLKATSMTNLVTSETGASGRAAHNNSPTNRPIHRPASRNALDSIHKGMNAKFTHVQSKVLLQNIRPQAGQASKTQTNTSSTPSSRIPSTTPTSTLRHKSHFASNSALGPSGGGGGRPTATAISRAVTQAVSGANKIQQSDRSQLINKIKALQEQIELQEAARDELRQELEREKADKSEQVQQVKLELQEKVAEYERHNEEYHQKLLEAYELADQNRRAADSVLSESRQREEELRKKIDELEQQLGELKEFVAMKEEMVGKMGELREQIRAERERYEDKTGQLGQMFENEKISSAHMRVDQNSNYFRRAKPSLQSVESINGLEGDDSHTAAATLGPAAATGAISGQQQQQQAPMTFGQEQQQQNRGQRVPKHLHHRSEHDIYGSKLSTRMQDGAKSAWKKSRKFASSVITGGLGGLSACRRNSAGNRVNHAKHHQAMASCAGLSTASQHQQHQQQYQSNNQLQANNTPVAASDASLNALSSSYSSLAAHHNQHQFASVVTCQPAASIDDIEPQQQQQHTSVIEVGVTVGDYIQQQQQQKLQQSNEPGRQQKPVSADDSSPSLSPQPGFDDKQRNACESAQKADRPPSAGDGLIRVDENNKLTIVTKFNDSDTRLATGGASSSASSTGSGSNQASSSSSSGSIERSRCESSSSGRGTASDSGSSGSQNGDHLDQLEGQQQQAVAKESTHGKSKEAYSKITVDGASSESRQEQQQQEQQNGADYQRHKRKSSLFKASSVFSGSQASLNKTIKSLFALKTTGSSVSSKSPAVRATNLSADFDQSANAPVTTSIVRHHHSFDSAPFHTICLSTESPPSNQFQQQQQHQRQRQSVPRLDSFKASKRRDTSAAVAAANANDRTASGQQQGEVSNSGAELSQQNGIGNGGEASASVSAIQADLEQAKVSQKFHDDNDDDRRTDQFDQGVKVVVHKDDTAAAATSASHAGERHMSAIETAY